jgi:hypothetical protein
MVANVEFLRSVRGQGGECLAVLVRKGPLSGLTTSSYMQVRYTCMGKSIRLQEWSALNAYVVHSVLELIVIHCQRSQVGLDYQSTPL